MAKKKKKKSKKTQRKQKIAKWVGIIVLLLFWPATSALVGNLTARQVIVPETCRSKMTQGLLNYAQQFIDSCLEQGGIWVFLPSPGKLEGICARKDIVGQPSEDYEEEIL